MRNGPRHQLLLYAQEKKRYRRTVRPNQQKNEKNMTTQLHNCLPPERSQIWSSEAKSPMSPRYNRKTWIDGLYHRGRSRMPLIMGHLLILSSPLVSLWPSLYFVTKSDHNSYGSTTRLWNLSCVGHCFWFPSRRLREIQLYFLFVDHVLSTLHFSSFSLLIVAGITTEVSVYVSFL